MNIQVSRRNFLAGSAAAASGFTLGFHVPFGNEAEVYLGGVEVRLHWFGRAHTNGDTVIEFPDLKTIHTGDIIIDAIPVIDYAGGGSAIEFLTTIDRMLTLDFDTAILGHGRTMTKQEVRDYRMRFAEMNGRMKALIDRGVTKDQLKTWDQARAALKLEELGWENTVSWTTFFAGFPAYYDEIAASK